MRITELFQNREFVVSAEIGPPKGIHIDGLVEEAKEYLTGVHYVNVTDNQSSVMRLGGLATCKVLKAFPPSSSCPAATATASRSSPTF